MERELKARKNWISLYEDSKNISYVSRHCGVSRRTLHKWLNRYKKYGEEGLKDSSKKPKYSPSVKVTNQIIELISNLRTNRNLGARRIQNELIRHNNITLSITSIVKVLKSLGCKPIIKIKREKVFTRYSRPIPGDRVQIDTCKIADNIFQYTAIDDCTRYRVIDIYRKKNADSTLEFIDKVVEQFPFPIQRIQSDRGTEFFAERVQKKLMCYSIKFRPIKPKSPHLNGKVERSQLTDLKEFYPLADLSDFEKLKQELEYWQFDYNWHRPHGSLQGKTPIEKYNELSEKTPLTEEVEVLYCRKKESLQKQNYYHEMKLRSCYPCL